MYQAIMHEWMKESMSLLEDQGLKTISEEEIRMPMIPYTASRRHKWIHRLPAHTWILDQHYCLSCQYHSNYDFHYTDTLSLALSTPLQSTTLMMLLKQVWEPDHLPDVICQPCTHQYASLHQTVRSQRYYKQSSMLILPKTLCLQLPLASYDMYGHMYKSSCVISPLPFLDVGRTVNQSSLVYQLRSLIVHYGTVQQGHYVTYRLGNDQCWYRLSDEVAVKTTWQELLRASPYLLFYEQVVPTTPL
jgi:hypothetical protein